jgi:hypothetical protein
VSTGFGIESVSDETALVGTYDLPSVVAGTTFIATLPGGPPGNVVDNGAPPFGARIEVPITGAIVCAFVDALINEYNAQCPLQAPDAPGLYIVRWLTGDNTPHLFDAQCPLQVISASDASNAFGVEWPEPDLTKITPTIDDVAMLEQTRTIDLTTLEEVGTFTTNTRPSAQRVQQMIQLAVDNILAEMRPTFSPQRYPQLKRAITFYAAMTIEGSFYREQQNESGVMWQGEYRNAMMLLNQRIEQDIVENDVGPNMEPASDYPRRYPWFLA